MNETIQIGDVVQVDFNGAQITLTREAEVLHMPGSPGDSWVFKARDTGMIYHVSEGCTVGRQI